MLLSIIIPCFNEIGTLDEIIKAVNESDYTDKEIVVIDDSSTDGTRERLKVQYENSDSVSKVLYHDRNMGKGAALNTGIAAQRVMSLLFRMQT